MNSYDQLPDTVAVVVHWPPGLPPFAFTLETADLYQPDDPADFDLPFAAASGTFDLFGGVVPLGVVPADSPYRSAMNAWVARGRPPVGVGARITVTVPGQPSVAHEIVSVDGGRVGWSPVE